MNIQDIKSIILENIELLTEPISNTFDQLFMRPIKIESKILDETNTVISISESDYPRVHLTFKSIGKNTFNHLITIDTKLSLELFAWMIGDEPEEKITDEHIEGLQEAVNQIFGVISTTYDGEGNPCNIDEIKIELIDTVENAITKIDEEEGTAVDYTVTIDENSYNIKHYFWFKSANVTESAATGDNDSVIEELEKDIDSANSGGSVNVNPTQFEDFNEQSDNSGSSRNIDMLLDVNLEAVVELGRKKILIKDILQLGRGSIIELDKAAGEPLDIYVNNRKLAEGEVVVIDERFGIRITHLIGKKERLQNLQ